MQAILCSRAGCPACDGLLLGVRGQCGCGRRRWAAEGECSPAAPFASGTNCRCRRSRSRSCRLGSGDDSDKWISWHDPKKRAFRLGAALPESSNSQPRPAPAAIPVLTHCRPDKPGGGRSPARQGPKQLSVRARVLIIYILCLNFRQITAAFIKHTQNAEFGEIHRDWRGTWTLLTGLGRNRGQASVGFASKTGMRKHNEDFAGALIRFGAARTAPGVVAAIADGIGGAKGGRAAARPRCRGFLDGFCDLPETMEVQRAGAKIVSALNGWINAMGRQDPELTGLGCRSPRSCCAPRCPPCCMSGDTRAYRSAATA